ncbi:MAG: OB-fold domain-containing protein [Chloroflexi bacterium]|nr:OB-fold domain-containing protein [Chloroflexota bacterium]
MPKVIPVADDLSKPFWDAVNQKHLLLQNCTSCDKLQYPPQPACQVCGSDDGLEWKEVQGKGHVATYIVIEDGRLNRRMPDQPYNLALITLDEDPTVNFYSNLPGTPPYDVPVGAAVEVTFEEVAPDQLIHEWRVIG